MAQLKLTSLMDVRNQVMCMPDTEIKHILLESLALLSFDPTIYSLIEGDLMRAALNLKHLRVVDAVEWDSATPALPGMSAATVEEARRVDASRLVLGDGRPRSLNADAVFILCMCRAHFGSLTSKQAMERLRDSSALRDFFESQGKGMPSRSTMHAAANCLSPATYEYILNAQMKMVFEEGLDSFDSVTADSFSVRGNTAWPTDSAMIYGLLRRAWHVAMQLPKFQLSTFTPGWVPDWLERLRKLDREIGLTCGKRKAKIKVRKLYKCVFERGEAALERLNDQFERLLPAWAEELLRHPARKRAALEQRLNGIANDLADAARVLSYARARVIEGKSAPVSDKVLSLSDPSAYYINKGDREPVLGYKPQIMRSRNGFVTAFELQQGNPADSARLQPLVEQHFDRTGKIPVCVSVDDGYTSRDNWEELKRMGVATVSMNGSKGKEVIPEDEWKSDEYKQARSDRSAVESLVFTLRFKFHLYIFARRGIEHVKTEMYEKVIAHNLWRTALLRKRAAAQEPAALPAAA